MVPRFTVAVCTHNRAEMLAGCLASLCGQTLDKTRHEILVVDNGSSDGTRETVQGFAGAANLRYVVEGELGLAHARNRGLAEARGQYVAYIDDDARAAPNWLKVADDILRSLGDNVDCLSGPYHPFYTEKKPAWFLDEYEIRGFGPAPRFLGTDEHPSGSNMIWSKETLKRIGGFDPRTGLVATQLRLGEETAAFAKLWLQDRNARVFFAPNMVIYHWVPRWKMTVSYRLKRRLAQGQFYATQLPPRFSWTHARHLAASFLSIMRASVRLVAKSGTHGYWQRWIAEDGGRLAYYLGYILQIAGLTLRIEQGGDFPMMARAGE